MADSEFKEEILEIRKQLEKLNSYPQVFLKGLITGIGTVIGATIVAGLLLSALSRVVSSIDDIPILNEVLNAQQIQSDLEDVRE